MTHAILVVVVFQNAQVLTLVHPARALLAARIAGANLVPDCMADSSAISITRGGHQWGAQSDLDGDYGSCAPAAQKDDKNSLRVIGSIKLRPSNLPRLSEEPQYSKT